MPRPSIEERLEAFLVYLDETEQKKGVRLVESALRHIARQNKKIEVLRARPNR
jgi:hypothetical protein